MPGVFVMKTASLLVTVLTSIAAAQNVSEQYLLAAANQERKNHGLGLVCGDSTLSLAARSHALEMARRRQISHEFSGEASLARRAGNAGARFSLVTENVAEAPNSAKIHELWMLSAPHRENLLDAGVNAVGIAVVQRDGQLYAVEDFAHLVKKLTIDQQEDVVREVLARSGISASPHTEDARSTCTMETGYAGKRQPRFVMRYTTSDLIHLPKELLVRLKGERYREAEVGACATSSPDPFTGYSVAILLFP